MATKVIFDTATKTIKIKTGITSIDFQVDVFSDGKKDWLSDSALNKFTFPIVSIGGNDAGEGKVVEPTFFIREGWQIEPASEDHEITIYGNIFHFENLAVVKVPTGSYAIFLKMSTTISPDRTDPGVVKRSSEDSLYNFKVVVDSTATGPYSTGTEFPTGTRSYPVNNMVDAQAIANTRSFTEIEMISDQTIAVVDLTGFSLEGLNHITTQIVLESSAILNNVTISNCDVAGVLDGGTIIEECITKDIDFFNGHIHKSSLNGKIVLAGTEDALIEGCRQLSFKIIPEFDMGVSGQDLIITDYTGMFKITNFNSSINSIGVGLSAGYVVLDSTTVLSGIIYVSGNGKVVDENGNVLPLGETIWNTNVTLINETDNAKATANAVWEELTADHNTVGTTGKALIDAGSAGNPWSSDLETNNTDGTFGWAINKVLSLVELIFYKK